MNNDRPPFTVELYTADPGRDEFTKFVAAIFMQARPLPSDDIFLPATYEHAGVWRVLRVLWVPHTVWQDRETGTASSGDVSEKRPDHTLARCVVTRSPTNPEWHPHRPEEVDPYKVGE